MPNGIITINVNDVNTAYTRCVLSQHSVLQSISKNTIPFASSVHMNTSINIDITGIYNINPHPIQARSRLINIISIFGHFTFSIINAYIDIAEIAYDIYIYVYTISCDISRNYIGYIEAFFTVSVNS